MEPARDELVARVVFELKIPSSRSGNSVSTLRGPRTQKNF